MTTTTRRRRRRRRRRCGCKNNARRCCCCSNSSSTTGAVANHHHRASSSTRPGWWVKKQRRHIYSLLCGKQAVEKEKMDEFPQTTLRVNPLLSLSVLSEKLTLPFLSSSKERERELFVVFRHTHTHTRARTRITLLFSSLTTLFEERQQKIENRYPICLRRIVGGFCVFVNLN